MKARQTVNKSSTANGTRAVVETSYLEVDTTLMMPVRYSMGFMLGGDYLSFYGMGTPRAFWHLVSLMFWPTPTRSGTSVAFMNTATFLTLRLQNG